MKYEKQDGLNLMPVTLTLFLKSEAERAT